MEYQRAESILIAAKILSLGQRGLIGNRAGLAVHTHIRKLEDIADAARAVVQWWPVSRTPEQQALVDALDALDKEDDGRTRSI